MAKQSRTYVHFSTAPENLPSLQGLHGVSTSHRRGCRCIHFTSLSAHLYEATSNPQYLNATEMSANFIATQLYNGVVILDTITVTNCLTTTDVVTYNSGFTIEGLSILSAKNSTYTTLWVSLSGVVVLRCRFLPHSVSAA